MEIPINVCKAFYTCDKCKKTTFAKAGCCVFCDYGDKPCPVSHKKWKNDYEKDKLFYTSWMPFKC